MYNFCVWETKPLQRGWHMRVLDWGKKLHPIPREFLLGWVLFCLFFNSESFCKRQMDGGGDLTLLSLQRPLSECCQVSHQQHPVPRALCLLCAIEFCQAKIWQRSCEPSVNQCQS